MNQAGNRSARVPGCCLDNAWCLAGAVILGVVLRLWWITINDDAYPAIPDDVHYFLGASSILNGNGYSALGHPITHWPVGYSAFLSGVFAFGGPSVLLAYVINGILTLISVVLVWFIARNCFQSQWAASVVATLCWLNPDQILACAFVKSEPLHQVVFYSLLLVLMSAIKRSGWQGCIWAGIATGVMAYIRPEYVIVPVLFGGAMFAVEKESGRRMAILKMVGVIYLTGTVVIAPAIMRLKRVTGKFYFMSTAAELALFHGNNPLADGRPQAMDRVNEFVPANETPRQYAVRYILGHPLRFVELVPMKFWSTYGVRMVMGTPFDVMIINKAPRVLSASDIERAVDGMDAQQKADFLAALDCDDAATKYTLKKDLSDEAKVIFMNTLLSRHTYDFDTPAGFVLLRYVYRVYRVGQFVTILASLVIVLVWVRSRRRLLASQFAAVLLATIAGISCVYMVLAGAPRYSFALLPLLWMYPVLLWSIWCEGYRPASFSESEARKQRQEGDR